ncbi:hypothetical protein JCM19301_1518 [Jejuia pallidilutea]|uniref:Uncharacterized protein n=1 Tax=Jejuia pallidilutea TaxID=504487 RepID=A0A090VZW0_9FLAO|nr:hypothetical protein JCM19301_1518 [Jejuia pallidilutea]GAL90762.1 hypothetical protein JCM19538_527 [Jejuia pallidilutea]
MASRNICKLKQPLYAAKLDATIIPETDNGSVRKRIAEIQIETFFIMESIFSQS